MACCLDSCMGGSFGRRGPPPGAAPPRPPPKPCIRTRAARLQEAGMAKRWGCLIAILALATIAFAVDHSLVNRASAASPGSDCTHVCNEEGKRCTRFEDAR